VSDVHCTSGSFKPNSNQSTLKGLGFFICSFARIPACLDYSAEAASKKLKEMVADPIYLDPVYPIYPFMTPFIHLRNDDTSVGKRNFSENNKKAASTGRPFLLLICLLSHLLNFFLFQLSFFQLSFCATAIGIND